MGLPAQVVEDVEAGLGRGANVEEISEKPSLLPPF